ncbi:MAG: TraR/DksA C4-type zinc finger protein [Burkholderiaceae bacterium]|nr:TraR/DksA C4-type zinc finger protein [Burkholderiaceae bacterium]
MHERETELSAAELQRFGERLRALRAEVAAALAAHLHQDGDERRAEAGLPRRAEETDDDAAAEAARQMDIAQLSHATAELAEIDAALARIAEGTYGICIDCGGPVGRARLQVQPMAVRCAPCQGQHERRLRR